MKKVFLVTMITTMLVFTATLASATFVPLGTVIGNGRAACAGVGCENYFTGVFTFVAPADAIFVGKGGATYTMSARSDHMLDYYDYNGTAGTPPPLSLLKGNDAAWKIENTMLSTTFYGQSAYWNISVPSTTGAGTVQAELVSDGKIHWYYGWDADAGGVTDLTAWNLTDSLYFNGTYQFLSQSVGSDNLFPYSITGTVYAKTVPEPTTMLLFSLGLLGLAGVRRKLKK